MADQLYINGREIDLGGGASTVIALSFSVNNIAELKDRQGNVSNQFTLPMTANNKDVLDSSELINSDTRIPYRKWPAIYIQNGVQIIQNGVAIVQRSSDVYEAVILSGNADFFTDIDGLKLSDIDWSDLDHVWDGQTVVDYIPNTEGVIYPIVDYGNASFNEHFVQTFELLPWVFIHTIMERIAAGVGWEFTGEILTSSLYQNLIVSTVSLKQDEIYLLAEAETSTDQLSSDPFVEFDTEINDPQNTLLPDGLMGNETVTVNPGGTGSFWRYKTNSKGKFTFKIHIFYHTDADVGQINIYKKPFGVADLVPLQISPIFPINTDDEFEALIQDVELEKWESIYVNMVSFFGLNPMTVKAGSTFECTAASAENGVTFGQIFPIGVNMPDITQTNFIKAIFQMFGITCQPVPGKKELRLVQFKEIVANKPLALDWSDKIDMEQKPLIDYRISSYGQQNWMRYKEDDDVTPELGDGVISIDDQNLEAEKEMFNLPFAATEMTLKLGGLTIPEYLRIDGAEFTGGSPRILILKKEILGSEKGGAITYYGPPVPYVNSGYENMAYFILEGEADSLGFGNNLIDNQYTDLKNTLNNFKRVTHLVKLDQIDISALDHFIPIYLKQHGNYFYLNKITEWIDGRLCNAELVLLGTPIQNVLFHLPTKMCCANDPILLNEVGSIPGGVWSGDLVTPFGDDYYFVPGDAPGGGITDATVTYTVGDLTWSQVIHVSCTNPTVTLDPFDPVSVSDPPFTLTGGLPLGGYYVVFPDFDTRITEFDPAFYGAGTFTIYYIYFDEYGCSSFYTQVIIVNP